MAKHPSRDKEVEEAKEAEEEEEVEDVEEENEEIYSPNGLGKRLTMESAQRDHRVLGRAMGLLVVTAAAAGKV